MERIWGQFNDNTAVLLTLFVILMSGFLITRLTNVLRMPRVSGYIIAGIVIGPCVLHLVPGGIVDRMGFVSDIALAFIAFGVGKFFKKDALRRTGREIVWITVSEALAAGALVTLVLHFLFGLSWDFSLILGAIATATAPASTMMTIGQYKARGEMVRMLLQIVALDDVVCLLTFSVVSAWVSGRADGALSVASVVLPIVWNLAAIAMGAGCGVILSRLLTPQRSRDNRLILVIAMLCGLSGLCAAVDISPLLSCMVFGAVYINLTKDKKLYRQISHFTPPVMSIFFIVSGMNLDLTSFRAVGAIGVAYFFVRIAGKYLGTFVSCRLAGKSPEICRYMGLALVPQAGVAIGLAFLGRRLLPPEAGELVLTVILSSSVLYELVGPVCAKKALIWSGAISKERLEAAGEAVPDKNVVHGHFSARMGAKRAGEDVSVTAESTGKTAGRRRRKKKAGTAPDGKQKKTEETFSKEGKKGRTDSGGKPKKTETGEGTSRKKKETGETQAGNQKRTAEEAPVSGKKKKEKKQEPVPGGGGKKKQWENEKTGKARESVAADGIKTPEKEASDGGSRKRPRHKNRRKKAKTEESAERMEKI